MNVPDGERRRVICINVAFHLSERPKLEIRNLINDMRIDDYVRKNFHNRPIHPTNKNHAFVRTANDIAKQLVATQIPVGNVIIDIGSKYGQTAAIFKEQRIHAIRCTLDVYDDTYQRFIDPNNFPNIRLTDTKLSGQPIVGVFDRFNPQDFSDSKIWVKE